MTFKNLLSKGQLISLHRAPGLGVDEAGPCAVEGRTLTASGALLLLSLPVHKHPHLLLFISLLRDPPPCSLHLSDILVSV